MFKDMRQQGRAVTGCGGIKAEVNELRDKQDWDKSMTLLHHLECTGSETSMTGSLKMMKHLSLHDESLQMHLSPVSISRVACQPHVEELRYLRVLFTSGG